ncbi:MAG: ATP-binding cassette domain-containing protein [Pseudomonadota bacterium]
MFRLNISKRLQSAHGAFNLDVRLDIEPGEFVTLFGPSGAGKTTLLRCLAGLEQADAGSLHANGTVWFDRAAGVHLPPQHRRIGYMFQGYALFPNMTVRGNLEFARPPGGDPRRVDELIEMMGLGALQSRKPATLSGGQQQRVALARALASEPVMLLLDEPFSALDAAMRLHLQEEVLRLQRHYGLTTVMVSHDLSEVYRLSQRVAVLEEGRLTRYGSPAEVFGSSGADGKFTFVGEVLSIDPADVVFAVTLLVGNQLVRVIASADEAAALSPGDRVMLYSKAFNPILVKC